MTFPGYDAVIVPDWPAPVRVRAASTQRIGGASRGSYASFNLSTGVGDDACAVARNRLMLAKMLDLPAEPLWLRQVHGTTVLDADRVPPPLRPAAGQSSFGPAPHADGAVTSRPHQPCTILTADCLPVLLCDRSGTRVGAGPRRVARPGRRRTGSGGATNIRRARTATGVGRAGDRPGGL